MDAKSNVLISIISVIVLIVFGYLILIPSAQSPNDAAIAEQEYGPWRFDTFAQCLADSGMRMYGSVTCSRCAKQKRLFGDSARFLNEIECNPRYEGAQTEKCLERDIAHTPTWILEDSDGHEVARMKSGFQSMEKLAEFSGCELVEDQVD